MPIGGRLFLTFWIQVSRDGWDDRVGSRFTIPFQRARAAGVLKGTDVRRLPWFLTDEQLETLTANQNAMIAKLGPPDPGHVAHGMGRDYVQVYEAKFQPVTRRYKRTQDVWLRYHDREDVQVWSEFLLGVLPGIVAPFANASCPSVWSKGGRAIRTSRRSTRPK